MVAGTLRRSVAPRPPPPQKSHLAGPVIGLPFSVAAAGPKFCAPRRCLRAHMQGPFPRLRLRADSHIPATQCCAARNPPPISSQRRLGAPAARQLGATPPKFSAARPHCGRAPTHATGPLGGPLPLMTPLSRGGADPESRVAADVHQQKPCLAPPPTGPDNERRLLESAAPRDRMLWNFRSRDAGAIVNATCVCLRSSRFGCLTPV